MIFARDLALRRNIVAGGKGDAILVYIFPGRPSSGTKYGSIKAPNEPGMRPKTSRSSFYDSPTTSIDSGMRASIAAWTGASLELLFRPKEPVRSTTCPLCTPLRHLSDTCQTPIRHLSDTYQTPIRHLFFIIKNASAIQRGFYSSKSLMKPVFLFLVKK